MSAFASTQISADNKHAKVGKIERRIVFLLSSTTVQVFVPLSKYIKDGALSSDFFPRVSESRGASDTRLSACDSRRFPLGLSLVHIFVGVLRPLPGRLQRLDQILLPRAGAYLWAVVPMDDGWE